jgi:Tol biopolymer transport system component
LEEDKANSNPYWSPDSQKIAYIGSDNQVRAMMADGSGRILLARNAFDYKNLEPVWSPDGQTVIFTQVSADLSLSWLMAVQYSPDGGIPVKIQNSDYLSEASFSPDGFWIAATGYPEGNRDVYIMTPSGAIRTALTKDEFVDFDPAWRPNVVNTTLTPTP